MLTIYICLIAINVFLQDVSKNVFTANEKLQKSGICGLPVAFPLQWQKTSSDAYYHLSNYRN